MVEKKRNKIIRRLQRIPKWKKEEFSEVGWCIGIVHVYRVSVDVTFFRWRNWFWWRTKTLLLCLPHDHRILLY